MTACPRCGTPGTPSSWLNNGLYTPTRVVTRWHCDACGDYWSTTEEAGTWRPEVGDAAIVSVTSRWPFRDENPWIAEDTSVTETEVLPSHLPLAKALNMAAGNELAVR